MSITYLEDGFEFVIRPVKRRGMLALSPGQNADCYGSKISTDRMVRFQGEKRLYRVYATCYSNAASHWIIRHGQTLHIR